MTAQQDIRADSWTVAGRTFTSRLIVGTGKYKSFEENAAALEASGAEIVAGGSIHVYGTLRGRAIAGLLGAHGTSRPRIFCRKLDAELLAIDGVYRTAEEIDPKLHGRAVQAWLDGDQLRVAALD